MENGRRCINPRGLGGTIWARKARAEKEKTSTVCTSPFVAETLWLASGVSPPSGEVAGIPDRVGEPGECRVAAGVAQANGRIGFQRDRMGRRAGFRIETEGVFAEVVQAIVVVVGLIAGQVRIGGPCRVVGNFQHERAGGFGKDPLVESGGGFEPVDAIPKWGEAVHAERWPERPVGQVHDLPACADRG